MAERFAIAQVTPYAWESSHEVNTFVERLSAELDARGHRVVIIAPSESRTRVRESRRTIRAAGERPSALLDGRHGPRLLAVGEVVPVSAGRRRPPSLPMDVARTVEELLALAPLDFVHVHEPFGPSVAGAALRHSHALNVGSFHAPTERVLSTQVARRMVELFFARLDARTASYAATRDLVARFFPADYTLVRPGATVSAKRAEHRGPVRIVFAAEEERGALRLFLRALRRLDVRPDWQATLWSPRPAGTRPALRRELHERVLFSGPREQARDDLLANADIVVCASSGIAPAPGLVLGALASGAVPLVARVPVYEELLDEGELGLLFEPGDVYTLAAQLDRLVIDESLRKRLAERGARERQRLGWPRVADEFERLYEELAARRHDARGDATVRSRLARRKLIDVDLHMHTDHSYDCATPVEVLLATAKSQGLGAIAVTDHNEISGAHEARMKANGIKVIVAEEVKTADQGEVIGLFIEDKIERGMTLQETIAEIKRQGGLVYVPHPFDRLHSVPDYEHLLDVLEDVDAIEVFNPRIAFKPFNEEAVRFAAKYRLVAGAGSDSHVPQGLGSVRIRMRDFDGRDEFLESLRQADIIRKPTSLIYVQALKFLQTKATPASARRASRARRIRRVARKS